MNFHSLNLYLSLFCFIIFHSRVASCTWLFIATWLKLPVSASHSVVGATLGYHIVVFADAGVDWYVVVKIGKRLLSQIP